MAWTVAAIALLALLIALYEIAVLSDQLAAEQAAHEETAARLHRHLGADRPASLSRAIYRNRADGRRIVVYRN